MKKLALNNEKTTKKSSLNQELKEVLNEKTLNNKIIKHAMSDDKNKKTWANNIMIICSDIIRMQHENDGIKSTKEYFKNMPLSYQIEHAKDMQRLNYTYNQNLIEIAECEKLLKNKKIVGKISKSDIKSVFELSEQQIDLYLDNLSFYDDLKTGYDEPLPDDLQQIKNDIRLKAFEFYGILLNTDESIKSREKKLSAYIKGLLEQSAINKTQWDCYTEADHNMTMFLNDLQEQNKKAGIWNYAPDKEKDDDCPED